MVVEQEHVGPQRPGPGKGGPLLLAGRQHAGATPDFCRQTHPLQRMQRAHARPDEYAGYIDNVDTEAVLDGCLVLVGHLLAKTNIRIERDLRAARRPAINRNELQQVLVNLLVNAIHTMQEGGTLRLASRDKADDMVEIEITDTGPGLGSELLAELFKPFVTRKKDGTGLGLWTSRTIVERYGGDIRAADRSDGTRESPHVRTRPSCNLISGANA